MSPIVLALFLNIILTISLCVLIVSLDKKTFLAWFLLIFSLVILLWTVSMTGILASITAKNREIWYKISLLSSFLVSPTAILAAWNLKTGKIPGRKAIALVFMPGLVFFLAGIIAPIPIVLVPDAGYGFTLKETRLSLSTILNVVSTIAYIPLTIVFLFQAALGSKNTRNKRQSRLFVAAGCVGLVSTLIIYLTGTGESAPLYFLASSFIYLAAFFVSIIRYRLSLDSPSFIMDRLWNRIDEALILTDESGVIVSFNTKAAKRFSIQDLRGKFIADLFVQAETVSSFLDASSRTGPALLEKQLVQFAGDRESIVYLSLERVADKYGDILGFMAIVHYSLPYAYVKEHYGITAKEWEVASLLAMGKEYKEIADSLFVSQYTVKNHVHNIYEKTKIKNRYEFLSLIFPF